MLNFKKNLSSSRKRDGISIIEVLTSMAVATIGVFGVMVMIPFAVKQSQTGLDNDAANSLGLNAIEELQINGYLRVGEQIIDGVPYDTLERMVFRENLDLSGNPDPNIVGSFVEYNCELLGFDYPFPPATPYFRFPGVIYFDPIGVANGLTSLDAPGVSIPAATGTRLSTVSATLPAGGPLTPREASMLCRSSDELFFETDIDDIDETAPPQPIFDVDSGGNQIRRQNSGRISWSVMLVPEKDIMMVHAPVSRFRSYAIVHRDREFIDEDLNTGAFTNYGIYLTDMAGDGHVPTVNQITFPTPTPSNRVQSVAAPGLGIDILADTVRRDDWVMLVNQLPTPDMSAPLIPLNAGVRAANEGYRTQVMFARVKRVTETAGGTTTLIVDGGSFDFVPIANDATATYMVHLKNVVNVFERSVAVER